MPFNVDSPNPADDAIVSQFPANERASRENIEDWMDFEHNKTTGRHKIPRGSVAARDGITDWSQGSLWINSDVTPNQLQVQINPGSPFAWVDVGLLPAGVIAPYAGSAAPSGWLLCHGQAVSRTTFAALFTAIGTTYGSGDGSTTFNLPDLRGRVPVGKDDMGGSAANRVTTGGSGLNGAQLGAAGGNQQMQSHSHTQQGTFATTSDGQHNHELRVGQGAGGSPYMGWNVSGTFSVFSTDFSDIQPNGVHTHNVTLSGSTANTGSGNAQNMQPSLILNYIIKT